MLTFMASFQHVPLVLLEDEAQDVIQAPEVSLKATSSDGYDSMAWHW